MGIQPRYDNKRLLKRIKKLLKILLNLSHDIKKVA